MGETFWDFSNTGEGNELKNIGGDEIKRGEKGRKNGGNQNPCNSKY